MAETTKTPPILVWPFDDAPPEYRALSTHGGDEDWVAFVPEHETYAWGPPSWMSEGSNFGCCCVSETAVDGGKVYIGAHA